MINQSKSKIKAFTDVVFELAFPPVCPFCSEIVAYRLECDCLELLQQQKIPGNDRFSDNTSGKTLEHLCFAVSSFWYKDAVIKAVYNNKSNIGIEDALKLAKFMADDVLDYDELKNCRYVIPVPSYKNKRKHCLFLSKAVSNCTSIQLLEGVLIKSRKTKKQHEIDGSERNLNLKNSFSVKNNDLIKGKDLLLCDDVITSGNTLNEAAKTLLENGANKVYAITFCKT